MAKRGATASAKAADYMAQIAEAAYYKAERRGFEPGYEMVDWLEAERELAKKPKKAAPKATKAKKSAKS